MVSHIELSQLRFDRLAAAPGRIATKAKAMVRRSTSHARPSQVPAPVPRDEKLPSSQKTQTRSRDLIQTETRQAFAPVLESEALLPRRNSSKRTKVLSSIKRSLKTGKTRKLSVADTSSSKPHILVPPPSNTNASLDTSASDFYPDDNKSPVVDLGTDYLKDMDRLLAFPIAGSAISHAPPTTNSLEKAQEAINESNQADATGEVEDAVVTESGSLREKEEADAAETTRGLRDISITSSFVDAPVTVPVMDDASSPVDIEMLASNRKRRQSDTSLNSLAGVTATLIIASPPMVYNTSSPITGIDASLPREHSAVGMDSLAGTRSALNKQLEATVLDALMKNVSVTASLNSQRSDHSLDGRSELIAGPEDAVHPIGDHGVSNDQGEEEPRYSLKLQQNIDDELSEVSRASFKEAKAIYSGSNSNSRISLAVSNSCHDDSEWPRHQPKQAPIGDYEVLGIAEDGIVCKPRDACIMEDIFPNNESMLVGTAWEELQAHLMTFVPVIPPAGFPMGQPCGWQKETRCIHGETAPLDDWQLEIQRMINGDIDTWIEQTEAEITVTDPLGDRFNAAYQPLVFPTVSTKFVPMTQEQAKALPKQKDWKSNLAEEAKKRRALYKEKIKAGHIDAHLNDLQHSVNEDDEDEETNAIRMANKKMVAAFIRSQPPFHPWLRAGNPVMLKIIIANASKLLEQGVIEALRKQMHERRGEVDQCHKDWEENATAFFKGNHADGWVTKGSRPYAQPKPRSPTVSNIPATLQWWTEQAEYGVEGRVEQQWYELHAPTDETDGDGSQKAEAPEPLVFTDFADLSVPCDEPRDGKIMLDDDAEQQRKAEWAMAFVRAQIRAQEVVENHDFHRAQVLERHRVERLRIRCQGCVTSRKEEVQLELNILDQIVGLEKMRFDLERTRLAHQQKREFDEILLEDFEPPSHDFTKNQSGQTPKSSTELRPSTHTAVSNKGEEHIQGGDAVKEDQSNRPDVVGTTEASHIPFRIPFTPWTGRVFSTPPAQPSSSPYIEPHKHLPVMPLGLPNNNQLVLPPGLSSSPLIIPSPSPRPDRADASSSPYVHTPCHLPLAPSFVPERPLSVFMPSIRDIVQDARTEDVSSSPYAVNSSSAYPFRLRERLLRAYAEQSLAAHGGQQERLLPVLRAQRNSPQPTSSTDDGGYGGDQLAEGAEFSSSPYGTNRASQIYPAAMVRWRRPARGSPLTRGVLSPGQPIVEARRFPDVLSNGWRKSILETEQEVSARLDSTDEKKSQQPAEEIEADSPGLNLANDFNDFKDEHEFTSSSAYEVEFFRAVNQMDQLNNGPVDFLSCSDVESPLHKYSMRAQRLASVQRLVEPVLPNLGLQSSFVTVDLRSSRHAGRSMFDMRMKPLSDLFGAPESEEATDLDEEDFDGGMPSMDAYEASKYEGRKGISESRMRSSIPRVSQMPFPMLHGPQYYPYLSLDYNGYWCIDMQPGQSFGFPYRPWPSASEQANEETDDVDDVTISYTSPLCKQMHGQHNEVVMDSRPDIAKTDSTSQREQPMSSPHDVVLYADGRMTNDQAGRQRLQRTRELNCLAAYRKELLQHVINGRDYDERDQFLDELITIEDRIMEYWELLGHTKRECRLRHRQWVLEHELNEARFQAEMEAEAELDGMVEATKAWGTANEVIEAESLRAAFVHPVAAE